MKKLVLLAIALGSMAVACTPPTTININPSGGGGDGGDGGSSGETGSSTETETETETNTNTEVKPTAHQVYIDEVHPSLIQTCGGCHNPDGQVGAPAFLDYDAEVSYPITKGYPGILIAPAESKLILKEPHEGPALSDPQKAIVGKWLDMEIAEGGSSSSTSSGGTQSGPMTLEDMLTSFGACMDFDLWSAGMDNFPLQQTNAEGPCMSCHNTGVGGTFLSGDPLETFEKNKVFPYVMRLVIPVYENGQPVDLAPSTRLINKGKETCQNPPICHPKFELTPENKTALESFVGTTLAKWQSGACPKP